MSKRKTARLACLPKDYEKLGIAKEIALFEDGLRTSGRFGEYEWWYFDAKLEDGGSLVMIFFSQPVTASQLGFAPSISFSLTRNGETFTDNVTFKPKDCAFSKEKCSVRMGNCTLEGDLKNYAIHYESARVKADITLRGNVDSWRPETGHIFFNEKKYFAWLPSVPEGGFTAEVTIDGVTETLTGTGYHDHNWGNMGMFWLMHHWYWGRAKVGDYQVISSYITAREEYGYEHFKVFLLSKDGQRIGDDADKVTYTQSDREYDPVTKKHYHKTLVYEYDAGSERYRITYQAKDIIEYFTLDEVDSNPAARASKLLLWTVALFKLQPSYIRMTGTVTLQRFVGQEEVESVSSPGIWEQMYFGLDEDV